MLSRGAVPGAGFCTTRYGQNWMFWTIWTNWTKGSLYSVQNVQFVQCVQFCPYLVAQKPAQGTTPQMNNGQLMECLIHRLSICISIQLNLRLCHLTVPFACSEQQGIISYLSHQRNVLSTTCELAHSCVFFYFGSLITLAIVNDLNLTI